MTTATPTPTRRTLRESAPAGGRVDRAAGVIRGCKIVGRRSPNTHGVAGVEGTEYTLEALRGALHLYEGCKVNVNHPPRGRVGMERDARDRFAWLEGCEVREAGVFGDLHFLDPADPLAVKLMNAAEARPDAFALSHNAVGRGGVRDGRYVVTEIPEVHSVDIVSDGGTNRSLFEGRAMKVKVMESLRAKVLPALQKGRARRLLAILEAMPAGDDAAVMEEAEGGDHRDHMYRAMRACEEAGDDESALKIHKLLGPPKKDADGDYDGDEGAGVKEGEGEGDDAEKKAKTEEARRRVTRLAKGFLHLKESDKVPAPLVEALVKLPDEDSRLCLLESWPRPQAAATPAAAARSAGRGATPLTEGRDRPAPKTAEDLAAALLR